MRTSIVILVLMSALSALAIGCTPSSTRTIGFEPRSYPYVPELGLDGPNAASSNPTK
jgi:hypothetical protein